MSTTIAVDVGGTQLRVALYEGDEGIPYQQARIPTRSSRGAAIDRLIELIASLWPAGRQVKAIGIAAPGPVNHKAGIIYAAPNIPGWIRLPLRTILQERFGVPVFVGNDANLALLGEWRFGAGQGHHNLLYMTISTGIGGGVISDDRLILGESGLATEVGHVTILPDGPLCSCGKRGHLEALASGTAIANYVTAELSKGRHSSLSDQPALTAKDISKAARAGDPLALEAFARAGKFLGLGITNYLHIFNPSIVILGGGVSQSLSMFRETMDRTIRESVMSPEFIHNLTITTAALGDGAGLLGAFTLARSPEEEMI